MLANVFVVVLPLHNKTSYQNKWSNQKRYVILPSSLKKIIALIIGPSNVYISWMKTYLKFKILNLSSVWKEMKRNGRKKSFHLFCIEEKQQRMRKELKQNERRWNKNEPKIGSERKRKAKWSKKINAAVYTASRRGCKVSWIYCKASRRGQPASIVISLKWAGEQRAVL